MLIEDGSLERADGGWTPTRDLGELDIPSTIEALLAARLDRLPRNECRAIEFASVVGQAFPPGAVEVLAGAGADAWLPAASSS